MVRSILYYILLVVFTLLCFIPFAVLFLLTVLFDRERVVLHWASRMWSYGIFRLCPCWRIRIEGAEKIDRSRPWVIVTNHQSMLDIPLMYVLPTTFKWVSKKEVQKMPVFGWVLWMHRLVEINRVYFFQTDKLFYGYRLVLGSFQLFKIFVGKNDEFSLFVFVCFDNILLLYGSAVALVAGFEISDLRHGLFVQQPEIHSV